MNKENLKALIEKEGNRKGFQSNGYTCLILRHPSLMHLCGYVLLDGSKFYGKHYDSKELNFVEVHGGLTFSEKCGGEYLPEGYWIGFDCAHYNDLTPYTVLRPELAPFLRDDPSVYRTMEYVESELNSLTKQLKDKENK